MGLDRLDRGTVADLETVREALSEERAPEALAALDSVEADLVALEEENGELQFEVAGLTAELDEERSDQRDGEALWRAAAVMHGLAHGGAFTYCQASECVSMKDLIKTDWREDRPGLAASA